MSLAEDLCYKSLKQLVRCPIIRNYRPDWLKNPKTGSNLEIDLWIEQYKLGFEIQGPHHLFDDYQIFKDDIKRETFKKLGYTLFEVGLSQINPYCLHGLIKSYNKRNYKNKIPVRHFYLSNPVGKKLTEHADRYACGAIDHFGITALSPESFKNKVLKLERENELKKLAISNRPIKFIREGKTLLGKIVTVISDKKIKVNHGGNLITVRHNNILQFL